MQREPGEVHQLHRLREQISIGDDGRHTEIHPNRRRGACREERVFESISEFPSIHYARPGRPYRYAWSMTSPPGWFIFDGLTRLDLETGAEQRFQYDAGIYASESPMVPRAGATAEDDGYLVSFLTDENAGRSECVILDAQAIENGPIARIALPHKLCSGTHSCWAARERLTA